MFREQVQLANIEVLNPFLTFCRMYDDLGAVSKIQIVGEYIIAFLNCFILSFHIISSTYLSVLRYTDRKIPNILRQIRRFLGFNNDFVTETIFTNYALYPILLILILCLISFCIRVHQMHSKAVLSRSVNIFNSTFDILSPCFVSLLLVCFFSSSFDYIIHENGDSLFLVILTIISLPISIFGVVRLMSDVRMGKLPYISPIVTVSLQYYAFLAINMFSFTYIEYSIEESYTVTFISSLNFIYGIYISYLEFSTPLFNNHFHVILSFLTTFFSVFSNAVLIFVKIIEINPTYALIIIIATASACCIVAVMHTFLSFRNIKKHIKSQESIEPGNYTIRRLCRILCQADLNADQTRFSPNFPEKVFQAFPSNNSIVVFAILYKLYDSSAHKEILKFTNKFTILNSTNFYITSMLRSITFIASGNHDGSSYTEQILISCYRLYKNLWYYIIQDNPLMVRKCLHDIAKTVQSAQPFFERHKELIYDYIPFIRNIIFTPDKLCDIEHDCTLDSETKESEKVGYSDESSEISIIDDLDQSYLQRLKSIEKQRPKNFKLLISMIGLITIFVILIAIISFSVITYSVNRTFKTNSRVQEIYELFYNIVPAWSIPLYVHNIQKGNSSFQYDKQAMISCLENISKSNLFNKHENASAIISKASADILETLETGNFSISILSTLQLINLFCTEAKNIVDEISDLRTKTNHDAHTIMVFNIVGLVICIITYFFIWRLGKKVITYLVCQPMRLNKSFALDVYHKYNELLKFDDTKIPKTNTIWKGLLMIYFFTFVPILISYLLVFDLNRFNNRYINFISCSIYITQASCSIAQNAVLLPSLLELENNSVILQILAEDFKYILQIVSKISMRTFDGFYNISDKETVHPTFLQAKDYTMEEMTETISALNKSTYVNFFNSSTIMFRDQIILITAAEYGSNLTEVIRMCIPSTIYCSYPTLHLIDDVVEQKTDIYNLILFTIIVAPFVYLAFLLIMFNYTSSLVSKYVTSVNLINRIICIPKEDNPFFDSQNNFIGFQNPPNAIDKEIFASFPVPIFYFHKNIVADSNGIARDVFGDIRGTKFESIPNEVIDPDNINHFYIYNMFNKSKLKSLELNCDSVVVSDDYSSLTHKRRQLKRLKKDIQLAFTIPPLLQRDKPVHIPAITVVNFCFSENLDNELFLDYSSKLEDLFVQFVTFFICEKQRFCFYVLFYEDFQSRQQQKDAIEFSKIAREIAVLNDIDVKIAISVENDVITKSQLKDGIWSVYFPNSILLHTDSMFKYADWQKIICTSKLMPGMRLSHVVKVGSLGESMEILIL